MGCKSIDDQIREEIERIAHDVIDWGKSQASGSTFKPYWKPRFAKEHFAINQERVIPLNLQTYCDLQLSRGATRNVRRDLNWEFEDPKLGVTQHRTKNEERLRHFIKHYPIDPNARVLEIGTRSGHFLYFLQAQGYNNVIGIDCVKLNVLWCLKNGLNVQLADAHELTKHFESDSLDAIFAYHVLEHCYDPERVLRESWSILKRGGGMHVEIPISRLDLQHAHCYSFSRRELGKTLCRIGFELIDYWHRGSCFGGIERAIARKVP